MYIYIYIYPFSVVTPFSCTLVPFASDERLWPVLKNSVP